MNSRDDDDCEDIDGSSPKPRSRQRRRRRRRPKADLSIPRDQYRALQCEWDDDRHAVTRAVLVNWDKQVILDITVLGKDNGHRRRKRLAVANHSKNCYLPELAGRLKLLLKGKVLIGYNVASTLQALKLDFPCSCIRDCATYVPFQNFSEPSNPRTLRGIAKQQNCTVKFLESLAQQAICCMDLYRNNRDNWEALVMKQKDHEQDLQILEENWQNRLLAIPEAELNNDETFSKQSATIIHDGTNANTAAEEPREIQDYEAYEVYRKVRSQSTDEMPELIDPSAGLFNAGGARSRVGSVGDDSWSSSALSNSIWKSAGDSLSSAGASEEPWNVPVERNLRPAKESAHPVDVGDWLNEPVWSHEDDQGLSGSKHLPSKLLSSDSEEDSDAEFSAPREDSSHLVDGTSEDDWLNQGRIPKTSSRREGWFRRKPSFERSTVHNDDAKHWSPHKLPFFRK